MTDEIKIVADGRPISRVVAGDGIGEVRDLLRGEREVFMVYDRHVEAHALKLEWLVRGSMAIDTDEESKDMETVLHICSWLMASGADRDALLLAVGGGITTDMAGFAASVYKRGIRFAYVPTTLLAQVDAAIGGKTGVNFEGYKNMLGVIRQPEFTWLCPDALDTLPRRDFLSGAAEMLKTFIIDDSSASYDRAATFLRRFAAGDGGCHADAASKAELRKLIFAAAAVKAGVVGRDQFERGERRKLNLGHTFAHAIEHQARLTGADITHGEAVAIGMIMAAHAADRLWKDDSARPCDLEGRLRKDFSDCGLPTDCPFDIDTLAEAMGKDKKAIGGGLIHFMLPYAIGDVRTADLTVSQMLGLR